MIRVEAWAALALLAVLLIVCSGARWRRQHKPKAAPGKRPAHPS